MRTSVQQAVAVAVLVLAASSVCAQSPAVTIASRERERVFCDRVLNVLLSVNLRRTGNGLNVAVLAMRPQLAEAERIASRLASESRRRGLPFGVTVWDLSKDQPVPLNTAAAILLEVTPAARQRVMLAARARNFLTIGRGPQDLNEVGVLLLADGDSYRNDAELAQQKLVIGTREMLSVLQPVSVYTTRKEELARAEVKRQEELARAEVRRQEALALAQRRRQEELAKKAKAELAQAHAAYRRARSRQLRRPVRWSEVAKELRSAIALHPVESVSAVSLGIGTMNEPYLPHFYLGEALAQIGDCDGAARELRQSEAATRRALNADIAARVTNAVERCGKTQPPAVPRGGR